MEKTKSIKKQELEELEAQKFALRTIATVGLMILAGNLKGGDFFWLATGFLMAAVCGIILFFKKHPEE